MQDLRSGEQKIPKIRRVRFAAAPQAMIPGTAGI
jgi:hypothetical protein